MLVQIKEEPNRAKKLTGPLGKPDTLYLANLLRLDTRRFVIITVEDCGTQNLYTVTHSLYFLLKTSALPLCYQRYRVHFHFPHNYLRTLRFS